MAKHATLNRIEAVWNILGGEEGVDRLLRGELVVSLPKVSDLPIWKTVKLGTGLKTADDFRKALKKASMKIGDWGNDILGKPAFTVSDREMELDLVNLSVADLGFKDGATRKDIIAKAIEQGMELCPAEVGPQIRLQYPDQPKGEWFVIAMEPITDSNGSLSVFDVAHDKGGRWLSAGDGDPANFWIAGSRFVFVRPRK